MAAVGRWISRVLAAPTFWALRRERTDLHQEVMGRLIESLQRGRFDASREFRSYVQGVARFAAYKAVARDVRTDETEWQPDGHDRADDGTEDRILAAQLAREALRLATEECRELIEAYFFEDRSYADLAQDRRIPVGTVKSRLFRCMAAVQKALRGPVGDG